MMFVSEHARSTCRRKFCAYWCVSASSGTCLSIFALSYHSLAHLHLLRRSVLLEPLQREQRDCRRLVKLAGTRGVFVGGLRMIPSR